MNRWAYPIMGLIINAMLGGVYAFSLYYPSLRNAYGIGLVAPFALAFLLATLFFAVAMPFAGVWYDKVGPKLPVITGALLILIGYLLGWAMGGVTDWSTASIPYYIGLGILVGLAMGFAYSVPGPVAAKWFPDRTGAAIGTAVLGFGIGAAVSTPLIRYFLEAVGVFTTFLYMGLIYFIVILAMGLSIRDPPPGYTPPKKEASVPVAAPAATLREATRSGRFYLLWFAYVTAAFAGLMVIGNAVPILKEGGAIGGVEAALIAVLIPTFIIITSIFNAAGRPSWGIILDKLGVWRAMWISFTVTLVILLLLSIAYVSPIGVFVLGSIIYFNYGGILAIFPSAAALFFGRKYLGRIYGVLFSAWGVAGLLGALTGALIKDITGSYVASFYVAALLSLIAAITGYVGSRLKR